MALTVEKTQGQDTKRGHRRPRGVGGLRVLAALYRGIKGFVDQFLTNNCHYVAAAITFYALFSFIPLTLALIIIASLVAKTDTSDPQLVEQVATVLPFSQDLFSMTLRSILNSPQLSSIAAAGGLLFASTAVFSAIRKGVNTAWGIKRPRSFLKERLIDLGLMIGTGLLFILALSSTTALRFFGNMSPFFPPNTIFSRHEFWTTATFLVPPLWTFITLLGLYRFLPNAKVRWLGVFPGAVLVTVAFEVGKLFFAQNVTRLSDYSLVYGSLGGLLALLSWTYIAAIILLVGAQLSSRICFLLDRRLSSKTKGDTASVIAGLSPLEDKP